MRCRARSFAATLRRGNRVTRGKNSVGARLGSLGHDETGPVVLRDACGAPEAIYRCGSEARVSSLAVKKKEALSLIKRHKEH